MCGRLLHTNAYWLKSKKKEKLLLKIRTFDWLKFTGERKKMNMKYLLTLTILMLNNYDGKKLCQHSCCSWSTTTSMPDIKLLNKLNIISIYGYNEPHKVQGEMNCVTPECTRAFGFLCALNESLLYVHHYTFLN